MVLIEAASYGIPSIICKIHGLDDIIDDGQNGYIVAQDAVEEMAAHVVTLFQSPELFRDMRLQALATANRYNASTIAERWQALIETLLSTEPNLSPFQSPMHFSNEETIYIADQLHNGLVESSRNTLELKTILKKIQRSLPMRLFQPAFTILDVIRKWWRKHR